MDMQDFCPAASQPIDVRSSHVGKPMEPTARLWPLVLLFMIFCTLSFGCHKRFPDPGEPVIGAEEQQAQPANERSFGKESPENRD